MHANFCLLSKNIFFCSFVQLEISMILESLQKNKRVVRRRTGGQRMLFSLTQNYIFATRRQKREIFVWSFVKCPSLNWWEYFVIVFCNFFSCTSHLKRSFPAEHPNETNSYIQDRGKQSWNLFNFVRLCILVLLRLEVFSFCAKSEWDSKEEKVF